MEPIVSIVIPCFNAAASIRETMRSAEIQGDEHIEIIAIDDGSTDETRDIILREFPRVRLVSTANQGASRARNLGTGLASGRFVQYLDADDILADGKIREQVTLLEQTGADVAYGDWQKIERVGDTFVLGDVVARAMKDEPELELFGQFWCPPAVYLFRRTLVERMEGWNERLPVIQDARFALDCALQGGRFTYRPGIAAYYRVHAGSLSRRDPVAFNRDVYLNAREVEAWWQAGGGLSDARRCALMSCIAYVARATYETDPPTFEAAIADLERLEPGYIPARPLPLKTLSRLVGYRGAEKTALWYRRVKRSLLRSAT